MTATVVVAHLDDHLGQFVLEVGVLTGLAGVVVAVTHGEVGPGANRTVLLHPVLVVALDHPEGGQTAPGAGLMTELPTAVVVHPHHIAVVTATVVVAHLDGDDGKPVVEGHIDPRHGEVDPRAGGAVLLHPVLIVAVVQHKDRIAIAIGGLVGYLAAAVAVNAHQVARAPCSRRGPRMHMDGDRGVGRRSGVI